MSFQEKLSKLQSNLKVGKGRINKFANFSYRNTEDILEAIKPHLGSLGLTLLLSESMEVLGEGANARFYKIVTATISDGANSQSCSSYTREDEAQKGLTLSQLSGAVGSYGAKMALRGILLLDDTVDDDTTNTHGKEQQAKIIVPDAVAEVKAQVASVTKEVAKEAPKASTSFRREKVKAVTTTTPSLDDGL